MFDGGSKFWQAPRMNNAQIHQKLMIYVNDPNYIGLSLGLPKKIWVVKDRFYHVISYPPWLEGSPPHGHGRFVRTWTSGANVSSWSSAPSTTWSGSLKPWPWWRRRLVETKMGVIGWRNIGYMVSYAIIMGYTIIISIYYNHIISYDMVIIYRYKL